MTEKENELLDSKLVRLLSSKTFAFLSDRLELFHFPLNKHMLYMIDIMSLTMAGIIGGTITASIKENKTKQDDKVHEELIENTLKLIREKVRIGLINMKDNKEN